MSASTAALAILAGGLAGCSGNGSSAVSAIPQTAPAATQRDTETVSMSVDRGAASSVAALTSNATAHTMPLKGHVASGNARHAMTGGPYDLMYYGGAYLTSAVNNNIYVNCSAGNCWGVVPTVFENNLSNSTMIHIVDQYVHATGNNRYPAGTAYAESYNTSGVTLQDQDIYNMVYAAAKLGGTGYGHMYHVFLQSGVSQCSSSAGGCYAQQYCAYHGSVDFSDIGHVIYSVEPYQGISGCSVGTLTNSTSSTLSVEEIDTITDPDHNAWQDKAGDEIGDICNGYNGNVTLNGTSYYIQAEYSNKYSACRWAP